MFFFQSDIFVFYSLIAVIIAQRLFELNLSARNENTLKNKYNARIVSPSENRKLKLFHSLWFIALIVEGAVFGRLINTSLLLISYGTILISQTLRILSIIVLV
jgi:isoprenylcysteine carboxyl methyltransferase (ICMT) family protein YpbQ